MIIDTHCHLATRKYDGMMPKLIADSKALGVGHCITQGTTPGDLEETLELARSFPEFVSPCLAIHPSECMECSDEQLAAMGQLCRTHAAELAGIGETGLDYYWDAPEGCDTETYYARQRMMLERHFALAEELGLNISLHTRERSGCACFEDAFAIARQFPKVRPVFHCFIGTQEQAERIFSELDGMISFTGILTFRKTEAVQAVASWAPLERIMVETDSPFLSPEPMRGQLNIPGRTRYVAEKIAALRQISLEEVAAATTANARRFFRLPALG